MIRPVQYLTYVQALVHHIELMRALGELRFGIFDRGLLDSTLARPKHAAVYDNADLTAQAATLCYGLIKNHPWVGGNKRTATHLTDHFLRANGSEIVAPSKELVDMVMRVDSDELDLIELTEWMKMYVRVLK